MDDALEAVASDMPEFVIPSLSPTEYALLHVHMPHINLSAIVQWSANLIPYIVVVSVEGPQILDVMRAEYEAECSQVSAAAILQPKVSDIVRTKPVILRYPGTGECVLMII